METSIKDKHTRTKASRYIPNRVLKQITYIGTSKLVIRHTIIIFMIDLSEIFRIDQKHIIFHDHEAGYVCSLWFTPAHVGLLGVETYILIGTLVKNFTLLSFIFTCVQICVAFVIVCFNI